MESIRLFAWNNTLGRFQRLTVDPATGNLNVTGGGGGGGSGPVTVADGADVAQGTTTDPSSANTIVGILKAIKAAVQGTLTVATHAVTQSGVWTTARSWTLSSATDSVNVGNFPATQPVSLATNTPDVTDRSARLLGHVTVDNASVAVTGPLTDTQLRATRVPVDASGVAVPVTDNAGSLTVDAPVATPVWVRLSDGAAAFVGQKAMAASVPVVVASDQSAVPTKETPATLAVTATAATGVAATATLPAAGAGLFHYITHIGIELYATAARTGGATPLLVTTTNLPGSPVWDFDTAEAIGAVIRLVLPFGTPLKASAANTATTIVAPIATTGIWRINVFYYTAT